ncbi:MAG TPA: hypothetical protein VF516_03210 [Kofleriaceae bacterium]
MTTNVQFPQGPLVGDGGFVTLEWQQWFQNPQFLTLNFANPITVPSGGTGLAFGTSGGVLAFTAATTIASSAALGANQIVLGGGAGVVPSTPVSLGTTTTVLHGNAAGAPTWGAVSLTADVSGILPVANGGSGVATASANTVFAGPTSGGAAAPGFRALTNADIALFAPITNSLSGDVSLNNTGTYFDGPSVAQGTTGTWYATGTVTLIDTAGAAAMNVKLWDGTTVIASARTTCGAASNAMSLSLSGFIASPAANIRISVNDATSTSGAIKFNASGNSKDSTITAIRIA